MSKTTREKRPARDAPLLVKRALILLAVMVAGTLIPQLSNGQRSATPATDDPSIILRQGEAEHARAGEVQTPPTDASVDEMIAAVSAASGVGDDLPVSAAEIASVSTVPGPYRKLGRIEIPRIGLDTQFGEGVFAKTLIKGPGHWPGTPMPGREGNSVLSGHRNTHTQPFKELDQLRPGNKIIVRMDHDKAVTYEVTKTTIVREAKFKDFVLRQPGGSGARQITLFACHPEGNPVFRIVVQASAKPLT